LWHYRRVTFTFLYGSVNRLIGNSVVHERLSDALFA
jgi:hypothetical protein